MYTRSWTRETQFQVALGVVHLLSHLKRARVQDLKQTKSIPQLSTTFFPIRSVSLFYWNIDSGPEILYYCSLSLFPFFSPTYRKHMWNLYI